MITPLDINQPDEEITTSYPLNENDSQMRGNRNRNGEYRVHESNRTKALSTLEEHSLLTIQSLEEHDLEALATHRGPMTLLVEELTPHQAQALRSYWGPFRRVAADAQVAPVRPQARAVRSGARYCADSR